MYCRPIELPLQNTVIIKKKKKNFIIHRKNSNFAIQKEKYFKILVKLHSND